MDRKKALLYLGLPFSIGFLIIIGLIILSLASPQKNIVPPNVPVPTITPFTNTGQPNKSVYSSGSFDKYVENAKEKNTVSASDAASRTNLVNAIGGHSGVVHQTADYIITYRSVADVFLIQILTININQARAEATSWLESQGLSLDGVCKLPVSFYVDGEIKAEVEQQNITVNPLPDGC